MSESAEESPAQRAARLRREKREKKILEGGGDRLAKITNVSGRVEDLQPKPPPRPTVAEDPGDVDIPHIPKALSDDNRGANDPPVSVPSGAGPTINDDDLAQLRQALRSQPGGGPGGGSGDAGAEDPLMKLMQQMMGMAGQGGEGAAGMGGGADGGKDGAPGPQLPPALASLLSGQGMPQGTTAAAAPTNAYIWQVVHALFALGLGLYMALVLPFTGSREERLAAEAFAPDAPTQRVFWIFTTAELALQSTRFMLERRQGGGPIQGGMVGTVAGFLPEPYRGRLLLAARYFAIWTTLVQDVMVAVFVLGVVAWWKDDLY